MTRDNKKSAAIKKKNDMNILSPQDTKDIADTAALSAGGIGILVDPSFKSSTKLPVLDAVHARIGNEILRVLCSIVARDTYIQHTDSNALKFSEHFAASDFEDKDIVYVFGISELGGNGFISCKEKFVRKFIDFALGGNYFRKKDDSEKSAMNAYGATSLDLGTWNYICSFFLEGIKNSFKLFDDFDFKYIRTERESRLITEVQREDVLSVFRINLICSGHQCSVDFILPYTLINPIKEKLASHRMLSERSIQDPAWRSSIEDKLRSMNINAQLILNGAISKVRELLELKVGHTVVLDKFADDPLEVRFNGTKVCLGKLGKAGDKVAVQLIEDVNVVKFNM
ncbi:MAG: FliM/FliN family flagellar motor switch protein [Proteobacteria bacterium]|nr:FliM/FliN family flagellar motor switch protein [Pseudomonadota bacterium]